MDSNKGINKIEVELNRVLTAIKEGKFKNEIDLIRDCIKNGDTIRASELKNSLGAFTVSATFNEKRKKEYVKSHTGLLHLDYDKLDDVEKIRAKVNEMSYTNASFVSPSGNGLKVFVKTDADTTTHTEVFKALKNYYDSKLGVESDKSVKDITRLCYVSYDPDLYTCDTSEMFKYTSEVSNDNTYQRTAEDAWVFTNKVEEFTEGNRNNFIHLYACNANRWGLELSVVLDYALTYSDASFNSEEIETSINSAYENNRGEFATVAKLSILPNDEKPLEIEESPFIPDFVYDNLPSLLKDSSKLFIKRERDVYLISALSVISGGLDNLTGIYFRENVYSNLYSYIIAPAASGKGSMKFAKQLGEHYHDELIEDSNEKLKVYKKEKQLYDKLMAKAKGKEDIAQLEEPEKPLIKMYFLPANTSSSRLINHLKANNGFGCMCETESDVIGKSFKQDWGGYSDILRRAFHGETITKSRKMDDEYEEIKVPKMSVTLTGTPSQVHTLIESVHDGLFSRFMFYSFTSDSKWENPFALNNEKSKKQIFNDFSKKLNEKLKSSKHQDFRLTEAQIQGFNQEFSKSLTTNVEKHEIDADGVVKRLGLMTFKIAMILSALRSNDAELICSETDFKIAMMLVKVFEPHNLTMLKNLKKKSIPKEGNKDKLLGWMKPNIEYTRKEIQKKSDELRMSERTLSNYLKEYLKLPNFTKVTQGVYIRTS